MKGLYFLVLALFLFTSYAAKFNIASTSTCTNTSKAGFCTKWEQNGTVEEQTVACFAGQMIVLTKEGYKTFEELQIGDQILSYDRFKGEVYTKVRGWFHRDPQSSVEYMRIRFQNEESILVSQKHNIGFTNEESRLEFRFASEVNSQQRLFGSAKQQKSIDSIVEKGVYAPMTYNSNYFVFTSKSEDNVKILAHDYANIKYPESYEPICNIIFSAFEYFAGKEAQTGIHPAAAWMMRQFDFLLE